MKAMNKIHPLNTRAMKRIGQNHSGTSSNDASNSPLFKTHLQEIPQGLLLDLHLQREDIAFLDEHLAGLFDCLNVFDHYLHPWQPEH